MGQNGVELRDWLKETGRVVDGHIWMGLRVLHDIDGI